MFPGSSAVGAVLWLLVAVASFAVPPSASANSAEQQPDTTTTARVEGYMHTDLVRALGPSQDGQFFLTASDDKTARLWNDQGQLLKVYRPPIAFDRADGKLYASALSPNGRVLALSGWTGWSWDKRISIYLMTVHDGKMIRRIVDLPAQVNHLAFNKDGSMLAVALGEKNGFRVYRTSDGVLLGGDRSFAGTCNRVAFAPNGQLVASAYDGKVRLYSRHFQLSHQVIPVEGGQPYDVRFSPDGRYLAVAYRDRAMIQVLAGKDLTFKYAPDMSDVKTGAMHLVTWSQKGRYLYGGGTASVGGRYFIRKWARGGVPKGSQKARYLDIPVGADTVMAMAALAKEKLAYTTADPALGALDEYGFNSFLLKRPHADFRGLGDRLKLSSNGAVVQFSLDSGGKRLRHFDFSDLAMRQVDPELVLHGPSRKSPLIKVQRSGDTLIVDGKTKLALDEGEKLLDYAVSLRVPLVALMTSRGVRLHHANGGLFWKAKLNTPPLFINLTRDNRYVVVASRDGVIRWLRVQGGGVVVSLFPHRNGQSWISWNSHGYYAASPGADGLLGWHTNAGKGKEARFDPISNFKATRLRPAQIKATFR
ncbi:WD40 repeat domain-containing protein [Magnetococcus sp. PR-3]|uniref:WD40 repeat domain-containing protein n=1 Tax=Magnetococcus sp. PR-3 TaxID=3120355 RepID=UPI002FCDF07B